MYTRSISIKNADHSFRIPELVQLSCRYDCKVSIRNNSGTFDTRSIMSMMAFDPTDGVLTLSADGHDDQAAVDALCAFLSK